MTSDDSRGRSSPALLVLAFASYSAAHLFNNTVLQQAGPRAALDALQAASGGWIEPVLVRSQVVLAAFLAVVVGVGRRRLADVGWSARKLLPGLGIALGAWAMLQAVLLVTVLLRGAPLELHASWSRNGLAGVGAGVLAQALGHALVEDTAFRGFFLPELRARVVRPGSVLALVGALWFNLARESSRSGCASPGRRSCSDWRISRRARWCAARAWSSCSRSSGSSSRQASRSGWRSSRRGTCSR